MNQSGLLGAIRYAYACWACKNRVLNVLMAFPLITLASLGGGVWAANAIMWKYPGELTVLILLPAGLVGLWSSVFRRSLHARGLSISPSYRFQGGAQAQFHLAEMDNPYVIRTQLRCAIPMELHAMRAHGVHSVTMDSPLLASDRTRERMVNDFNALFEREASLWRAVDSGSWTNATSSFFFVLSYYKGCYLQENLSWARHVMQVYGITPKRSDTWLKLARDRRKRLMWGGISFKAIQ